MIGCSTALHLSQPWCTSVPSSFLVNNCHDVSPTIVYNCPGVPPAMVYSCHGVYPTMVCNCHGVSSDMRIGNRSDRWHTQKQRPYRYEKSGFGSNRVLVEISPNYLFAEYPSEVSRNLVFCEYRLPYVTSMS